MPPAPPLRVGALDGLRGWAALSVVGYHFYLELFGRLLPREAVFALCCVLNGQLAVAIFFVLSGYVLTVRGWRSADKTPILRQIAKRHARLAVPILANALLVGWLMARGLTFNGAAAAVIGRSDWLAPWLQFTPDLGSILQYAVVGAFWFSPPAEYNPFLWTMIIELWMSYLVLVVCLFHDRIGGGYGVLVVLLGLATLVHPDLGCFVAGALLALLHRDGRLSFRLRGWRAAAVVVPSLLAAGALQVFGGPVLQLIVIAPAMVWVAIASDGFARLMTAPVSRALSALSFPLYLAQFPVLVSASAALIVARGAGLGVADALLIGTVSIGLTFGLAVLTLPIEWLALWVGRQVERLVPPLRRPSVAAS
jgi:peptidoglycan/LPS O-acetylase OafA/YrhL